MKRVHGVTRKVRNLRSFILIGSFLFCMTHHAQGALLGVGPPYSYMASTPGFGFAAAWRFPTLYKQRPVVCSL